MHILPLITKLNNYTYLTFRFLKQTFNALTTKKYEMNIFKIYFNHLTALIIYFSHCAFYYGPRLLPIKILKLSLLLSLW